MKHFLLYSAAFVFISAPVMAEDAAHGGAAHIQEVAGDAVNDARGAVSDVVTQAQLGAAAPVSGHVEPAHWGYGAANGAQKWAALDAKYEACGTGAAQSPINIDKFLQEDLPDIVPAYHAGALSVMNNGHTVQVNVPAGSGFSVGGVQYELVQLHFHTPSEHYLDGAPYPMEVHFVHQAADGGLGVIGAMMKVGAHHPVIEGIWQNVPAAGESKDVVGVDINPADLMPASLEYYKYDGSLTTPPCSEGVAWHVLKEPIEISEVQLTAFQSVFPVNARPVQPLNDRVVTGD